MKNLLSILFIAFALTCNAQTKADSIIVQLNEYTLTVINAMSQDLAIHIDSIVCNANTTELNAFTLSKAANIDVKNVKLIFDNKKRVVVVYFRKEIMIGDY